MNNTEYLQAEYPTPVLNRPDFDVVYGTTLVKDSIGLTRALEFIALPGTLFKVVSKPAKWNGRVCEVLTNDYSSKEKLYIDIRFCRVVARPLERVKVCPPRDEILASMHKMVGLPYVWGGNYYQGVDQMQTFFPLPDKISKNDAAMWLMKGVDCSGMLYQATNGFTPRNTIELCSFGVVVEAEDQFISDIPKLVKPLDAIVWCGHVVVVLNDKDVIESRFDKGCVITNLEERLEEIIITHKRRIADNYSQKNENGDFERDQGAHFTIRRWYGVNQSSPSA